VIEREREREGRTVVDLLFEAFFLVKFFANIDAPL
jgi:hypothetical protein